MRERQREIERERRSHSHLISSILSMVMVVAGDDGVYAEGGRNAASDLDELARCIAPAIDGLSSILPPLAARRLTEVRGFCTVLVSSYTIPRACIDTSTPVRVCC